jgi:hypothetical protein
MSKLRLHSLPWAELGLRFRAARIAGNEPLAEKLATAVRTKKKIREARALGLVYQPSAVQSTEESK